MEFTTTKEAQMYERDGARGYMKRIAQIIPAEWVKEVA